MVSRKEFIKLAAILPFGSAFLGACGVNLSEGSPVNLNGTVGGPTENNTAISSINSGESNKIASDLPKKGRAPGWENTTWINSPALTLTQLQGKVVLVEFWTFDCYNCQNVMPALKSWYKDYNQLGLEIIGFHSPEFDHEKKLENVQQAVKQRDITYPVALDNDFKTWNKFGVRAWPSLYLVDKQGFIRYSQVGEGAYDRTRGAIESLLKE